MQASALDLVTTAIILFNCRYLGHDDGRAPLRSLHSCRHISDLTTQPLFTSDDRDTDPPMPAN